MEAPRARRTGRNRGTQLKASYLFCTLSLLCLACFHMLRPQGSSLGEGAVATSMVAPWSRTVDPGFDGKISTHSVEGSIHASARAKAIIDSAVADALLNEAEYGGLVKLRNVVGPQLLNQMHKEAELWNYMGWLQPQGSRSSWQEGRGDRYSFVDRESAAKRGSPALVSALALLTAVCAELARLGKESSRPLLPTKKAQLSCFEGGARYLPHRDGHPIETLDPCMPTRSQRIAGAREVSAILYLQTSWKPEWNGALRAHRAAADEGDLETGHVDVAPEGGTLLLFRSKDLVHEVLPTESRRFALTMWYVSEAID